MKSLLAFWIGGTSNKLRTIPSSGIIPLVIIYEPPQYTISFPFILNVSSNIVQSELNSLRISAPSGIIMNPVIQQISNSIIAIPVYQ